MYVIYDSITESLIGPFNDYDSAQMFMLQAEDIVTNLGQADLSIEYISEPQEWAIDNSVSLEAVL